MKTTTGNIWDLHQYADHWVVIPTNYGWTKHGTNVMGRGLAKQAALKFPHLPKLYGKVCRDTAFSFTPDGSTAPMPFMADYNTKLVFFIVKPLNKDAPNLSWQRPADIETIRASLSCLIEWMCAEGFPLVAIPLVGCGNGGLDPNLVVPVLEKNLHRFDNVVLVYPEGS